MRNTFPILIVIGTLHFIDSPDAAAQLTGCISLETSHNDNVHYWANNCSQALNVKWYDENLCANGCNTTVQKYKKTTITKIVGRYQFVACPMGSIVHWRGGSNYRCE